MRRMIALLLVVMRRVASGWTIDSRVVSVSAFTGVVRCRNHSVLFHDSAETTMLLNFSPRKMRPIAKRRIGFWPSVTSTVASECCLDMVAGSAESSLEKHSNVKDHSYPTVSPTCADDPISSDGDTVTPTSSTCTTTKTTTRYTIDFCPPTDALKLQHIVHKHVATLDRYLTQRPIAQHTQAAFDELCRQLKPQQHLKDRDMNDVDMDRQVDMTLPIVLDSGCGTGRSSLRLGMLYPQWTVIGVDRSISRLSKQQKPLSSSKAVLPRTGIGDDHERHRVDGLSSSNSDRDEQDQLEEENENYSTRGGSKSSQGRNSSSDMTDSTGSETMVQQVAGNVWLVRAELIDFWRLLASQSSSASSTSGSGSGSATACPVLDNDANVVDRVGVASGVAAPVPRFRVMHHYLLYPNPYPKLVRLTQRWYAHASFPLLMELLRQGGGDDSGDANHVATLVVRSNWKQYLSEFAAACRHYNDAFTNGNSTSSASTAISAIAAPLVEIGPTQDEATFRMGHGDDNDNDKAAVAVVAARIKSLAWTNFEEKYWLVGEHTYELTIRGNKYQ